MRSDPWRGKFRYIADVYLFGEAMTAPVKLLPGTWRTATIAQTWQRFSPLAKRVGITRIANITGLDTLGIPVFSSIRPRSRSLSTQQGKGVTADAARVSALMESLETWHAEHLTNTACVATYKSLRKRCNVVDIKQLAPGPQRVTMNTQLRWIEGWDMVNQVPVWVPEQAVTLDCVFGKRPRYFDVSSNGLASGNTMVEAAVHGLCEVIERDAEAQWRRAGADRRLVLETVSDPNCCALLAQCERAGMRVWAWNITADIEVPVMGVALAEDPRRPRLRELGVYQGFGCHPDAAIALSRAITEAAQTRLTYIAGARDDFFPFDYARATDPDLLMQLWQQYGQPPEESLDASSDAPGFDIKRPAHVGTVLQHVLAEVKAAGATQVIAVDLRQPRMGVPVVKIVVPGRATDVEAMG